MSAQYHIRFIVPGRSYAPELGEYAIYLEKNGFSSEVVTIDNIPAAPADIDWHIMGFDPFWKRRQQRAKVVVHEYSSLSTPPAPVAKDFIKKALGYKPDLRLFLNEMVREKMGFRDKVPHLMRDMAIDESFFIDRHTLSPHYDFVYLGTMHASRKLGNILRFFMPGERMAGQTILMIGEPPAALKNMFTAANIHFTGRVPYREIPALLAQARYAINYIPDEYPFNLQTSTKLLEYCAVGLPVLTNSYEWVDQFEKENDGRFLMLKNDFSNFTMEEVRQFAYHTPDLSNRTWTNMFDGMSLIPVLKKLLSGK
jgi:hypothetical protein